MSRHHRHRGLRKVCRCSSSRWPKCPHAWHFNFKPRGGTSYRFSLDAELGRHIETKTDAENEAARIRAEILADTFQRADDRRARPARQGATPEAPRTGVVTLDRYIAVYVERASQASGKSSWRDDRFLLT